LLELHHQIIRAVAIEIGRGSIVGLVCKGTERYGNGGAPAASVKGELGACSTPPITGRTKYDVLVARLAVSSTKNVAPSRVRD